MWPQQDVWQWLPRLSWSRGRERGCTPATPPPPQRRGWAGLMLTARQSKHTKEALLILEMKMEKKKGKQCLRCHHCFSFWMANFNKPVWTSNCPGSGLGDWFCLNQELVLKLKLNYTLTSTPLTFSCNYSITFNFQIFQFCVSCFLVFFCLEFFFSTVVSFIVFIYIQLHCDIPLPLGLFFFIFWVFLRAWIRKI